MWPWFGNPKTYQLPDCEVVLKGNSLFLAWVCVWSDNITPVLYFPAAVLCVLSVVLQFFCVLLQFTVGVPAQRPLKERWLRLVAVCGSGGAASGSGGQREGDSHQWALQRAAHLHLWWWDKDSNCSFKIKCQCQLYLHSTFYSSQGPANVLYSKINTVRKKETNQ